MRVDCHGEGIWYQPYQQCFIRSVWVHGRLALGDSARTLWLVPMDMLRTTRLVRGWSDGGLQGIATCSRDSFTSI